MVIHVVILEPGMHTHVCVLAYAYFLSPKVLTSLFKFQYYYFICTIFSHSHYKDYWKPNSMMIPLIFTRHSLLLIEHEFSICSVTFFSPSYGMSRVNHPVYLLRSIVRCW